MKNYTNMTLKQNSSAKHLALLKIFALCAVLVLTVLLISACPNAGTQNNGAGGQPLFPGDKEYMLSAGSSTFYNEIHCSRSRRCFGEQRAS